MGMAYSVDTPYMAPLGGSQSAVCYLAEQLTAHGWEVTFFNNVRAPGAARGVAVRPVAEVHAGALASFDAAVVVGGCPAGFAAAMLRRDGSWPFMAYWTGHMADQAAVANLRDPAFAAFWTSCCRRFRASARLPQHGGLSGRCGRRPVPRPLRPLPRDRGRRLRRRRAAAATGAGDAVGVRPGLYPNTFEETSCIAALEALGLGCLVATSDLGALPEALDGFGCLLKPSADKAVHAAQFAETMVWPPAPGRRARGWIDWLPQAMASRS